jgi:hypothetical protein
VNANGVNANGVNENVVTDPDDADVNELPLAFVAKTVYVCAVPCSCATTTDVEAVVPDFASDDAQEYPVIAEPPVAGAVQDTVSDARLAFVTADGAPGVAGTVVTVTAADAVDAAEVPAALVAVTVNVGVAAEAIPVTTRGDDAPVAV